MKHADRWHQLPEAIENADQSLIRHLQIEEWFQQALAERKGGSGT